MDLSVTFCSRGNCIMTMTIMGRDRTWREWVQVLDAIQVVNLPVLAIHALVASVRDDGEKYDT